MPQHVGMQRKRHKGNNVRIPHSGECGAGHIPAIGGRDNAGVVNGCETGDGVVKFYSKEVPAADISTCIILFGKGGGGESDLTVATREQLGHVKIGNGIEVTEDGTISANAKVSEDQIATSDDTSEMLKEIYGE